VTVVADRLLLQIVRDGLPEAALYRSVVDAPFAVAWYDSGMTMGFDKKIEEWQSLPPLEGMRPLLKSMVDQCEGLLSSPAIKGGTWDVYVYSFNFLCNHWLPENTINLRGGSVGLLTAGFIVMPTNLGAFEFNPAYTPVVGTGLSNEMNFWERLRNLGQALATHFLLKSTLTPMLDTHFKRMGLPPQSLPPIDATRSGSLFLLTNHWGYEYSVYHSPATRLIGSLTASDGKPLTGDLSAWMEEAPGVPVIVLSLGSTSFQSKHMIRTFARTLRGLPDHRMVWKVKTEAELAEAAEEVRAAGVAADRVWLTRWVPYNDLLAHEATDMAIVHCGNNGMSEAMFHGVPVVGVPQFADQVGNPGDDYVLLTYFLLPSFASERGVVARVTDLVWVFLQFDNCKKVARAGFGLFVPRDELSADALLSAVHRVLREDGFRENASRMKRITRGAPRMEGAVQWVEYVGENGVRHLTMHAAARLNVLQRYSLDTVGFIAAVAFATLYCGVVAVRAVLRRLGGRVASSERVKGE
jgi:hypothetical protein